MRRIILLGSLIYLLLLAGLAARSRGLLALAIPLVIYLAAAFLFRPAEPRLTAARTLSTDRLVEGAPVVVRVSIANEGADLEQVYVQDKLPGGLGPAQGQASALGPLASGASIDLEYTAQPERGQFSLAELEVTASDLLGLAQRRVELSAPAQLTAQPGVLRLKRLPIRPQRTRATAGTVPARQGGPGVDFFGVREYQAGDPRRWINWRASARHPNTLYTNEFQQERIADVGLILDARLRSNVHLAGDSLFDHAVLATAALADAFLRDGNRVGLLVYGQYLAWTFPGYGKVQRERILQSLARAEPGASRVFEKLENLPTRYFPAQSQIVLVSPLSREDIPALTRLRSRGYQLLVIRPDPVAFELQELPSTPSVEQAARIVRVEQALVRRRLLQAGIQIVDWPVDRPFDQVVHASLGRQPQWFRAVKIEL